MVIIILRLIVLRYNASSVPVERNVIDEFMILASEEEPVLPVLLVLVSYLHFYLRQLLVYCCVSTQHFDVHWLIGGRSRCLKYLLLLLLLFEVGLLCFFFVLFEDVFLHLPGIEQ